VQYLPQTVEINGETYTMNSILNEGTNALIALYVNDSSKIVAKIANCSDPVGKTKQQKQLALVNEAVANITSCKSFSSSCMFRLPLKVDTEGPCMIEYYDYIPTNLHEWIESHPERTSDQIKQLFLQLYAILMCLRNAGYWYNDIKGSNFLVKEDGTLIIGDLNGLNKFNDPNITLTPSHLPPSFTTSLSWSSLDVVTSFLLGDIILLLLVGSSALASFYTCIQSESVDRCLDSILDILRHKMPATLPITNDAVRDLAAIALILLGYRQLSTTTSEIQYLQTTIFDGA
jgi:serine/threonine protein kinase